MKYQQIIEKRHEIQQALGIKRKINSPLVNTVKSKKEQEFLDYIDLLLSGQEITNEQTINFLDNLINENPYLPNQNVYLPVKLDTTIKGYARHENNKIDVNLLKIKSETKVENDKLKSNFQYLFFSIFSLGHEYTHYLQHKKPINFSEDVSQSIGSATLFQSSDNKEIIKLQEKTLKVFKTQNRSKMRFPIYHTYPYEQVARNYSGIFLKTMIENFAECYYERGEPEKAKVLLDECNTFLEKEYLSMDIQNKNAAKIISSAQFDLRKLNYLFSLISRYTDINSMPNQTDEAMYKLYAEGETDTILANWQEYKEAMHDLYKISNEAISIFCTNASREEISQVIKVFVKFGYNKGIRMLEDSLKNCHNPIFSERSATLCELIKKEDLIKLLSSEDVTEATFKNVCWSQHDKLNEDEYRNLAISFFKEGKFAYLQYMLSEDLTHDEEIVAHLFTSVGNYIDQINMGDKEINPYDYNYLCRICSQFDDKDINMIHSSLVSVCDKFTETITGQSEDDWYQALEKVYGELSATDIDLRRSYSQDSLRKMEVYVEEVETTKNILES